MTTKHTPENGPPEIAQRLQDYCREVAALADVSPERVLQVLWAAQTVNVIRRRGAREQVCDTK